MMHLFIINPAAGSRDGTKAYTQQIHSVCREQGLSYEIAISQKPGDCARIAREYAQTGQEIRIYSCGGDGTLNEIVSGIVGFPNVAVTMFAGGSGNDFVRIFNETQPFRDLNRLLDAKEASFDLIRCNDRYSLNICSIGLDARIGTDVSNYKRIPLLSGFRAYALSAVINTIRGVHEHYVVEIDGEEIDANHTLICVCNGRFYGGGFNPVPSANPADGKLEVLLVTAVSRLKVLEVVGKYKNGQFEQLPQYIRHISTDSLRIRCDKPTSVNLDGELMTAQTIDISLAPEKIRFFYPKELSWEACVVPAL